MKTWTPQKLYDAKPWAFVAAGAGAAALLILGAAILQTRREYRTRSEWQREKSR